MSKNKAFTIIELLIATALIGVIAVIGLRFFSVIGGGAKQSAKIQERIIKLQAIADYMNARMDHAGVGGNGATSFMVCTIGSCDNTHFAIRYSETSAALLENGNFVFSDREEDVACPKTILAGSNVYFFRDNKTFLTKTTVSTTPSDTTGIECSVSLSMTPPEETAMIDLDVKFMQFECKQQTDGKFTLLQEELSLSNAGISNPLKNTFQINGIKYYPIAEDLSVCEMEYMKIDTNTGLINEVSTPSYTNGDYHKVDSVRMTIGFPRNDKTGSASIEKTLTIKRKLNYRSNELYTDKNVW